MLARLPEFLATYGPLAIVLMTMLAALGLPSPASLTLIAAGALSSLGDLGYSTVVVTGMVGTVTGDHFAYGLAHRASSRIEGLGIMRRLGPARRLIERRGTLGVFLSRFVFPTLMTPTTNYVSGLSRLALRRFTPAVIAGQLIYVTALSGLGRLFSDRISEVHRISSLASFLAFVALVAVVCAFLGVRAVLRRQLRSHDK